MIEIKNIEGLEYPNYKDELKTKIISPIFNNLPPVLMRKFLSLTGLDELKKFEDNDFPGSYKSIQEIYKDKSNYSIGGKLYFNSKPIKAIRNRLKIHKTLLKKIILEEYKNEEEINILDLGAGNEKLGIEVLSDLRNNGFDYRKISIIAIDGNKDAEYDGLAIAREYNVEDRILFVHDRINFEEIMVLLRISWRKPDRFST